MADPKIRSNRADGRAVISGMEVMSLRVEGGERDSSSYGNSCRFAREERKEEARKSMNGMSRTRLRWAVRRPSVYAARLRAHEIIVRTGPKERKMNESGGAVDGKFVIAATAHEWAGMAKPPSLRSADASELTRTSKRGKRDIPRRIGCR